VKHFIFVLLLSLIGARTLAKNIETEVSEFQNQWEQKISQIAAVQFGSRDAVAVSVRLKLKPKSVNLKQDHDVGYMPWPSTGFEEPKPENFEEQIQDFFISLVFSTKIEKSSIQSFQASVRKLLASYKPKITVYSVESSDVLQRKPASTEPPKPEPDLTKATQKDYLAGGALLAASFVVGFMVFLGLYFFASALAKSAGSISQAFGAIRQQVKTEDVTPSVLPEEQKPTSIETPPTHSISSEEMDKSLKFIKQTCVQDPFLLVSLIGETAADQQGLRWLLSQLSKEEINSLQTFLGIDRLSRLEKNDSVPVAISYPHWLQNIVEGLTLKQIQGKGILAESLTPLEMAELFSARPMEIFECAKIENSPSMWRLVLSVISEKFIEDQSAQLSSDNWSTILEGGKIKSLNFKPDLQKLRNFLLSKQSQVDSQQTMDPAFASKTSSSLLKTLKQLPFGDDQKFLQSLETVHPFYVAKIKEQYWTYQEVSEIEPSALKLALSTEPNETVAAFLFFAGETLEAGFRELLPAGMRREVVLDLLSQMKKKLTDQSREKSQLRVKDFISRLNKLHLERKLLKKKTLEAA
jgi:hypothetical protein